ncbi:MAG TPA: hypothetical protein VHS06_00915 [Chloroflexota bacterium]|nr:hypothetical protein [Chloroflexota bacterium]
MTHTLHRRGRVEDLAKDYVFTTMASKGINVPGTAEEMKKFYEVVLKHNPTFVGDAAKGNQLTLGIRPMVEGTEDRTIGHAVFRDADTVAAVIADLIEVGFNRSVVVSGLFENVKECCQKAGIGTPHTIEYSLETWGKTEKMAPMDELEVMTMCGHAQVPGALVRHVAQQVKAGKLTAEEAGKRLGRQCACGVFNVARASELVAAMAARM